MTRVAAVCVAERQCAMERSRAMQPSPGEGWHNRASRFGDMELGANSAGSLSSRRIVADNLSSSFSREPRRRPWRGRENRYETGIHSDSHGRVGTERRTGLLTPCHCGDPVPKGQPRLDPGGVAAISRGFQQSDTPGRRNRAFQFGARLRSKHRPMRSGSKSGSNGSNGCYSGGCSFRSR